MCIEIFFGKLATSLPPNRDTDEAVFSKFTQKSIPLSLSKDINKNVYEGNDYLPEIYEQWIQDSSRDNFVVLSTDEVLGVTV